MSTPVPPNCRLEGLELYVPRRARPQPAGETDEPAPQSPQKAEQAATAAEAPAVDGAADPIRAARNAAPSYPASRPSTPPAAATTAAPPTKPAGEPVQPAPIETHRPPSAQPPSDQLPSGRNDARRRLDLDPEIVPEPLNLKRPRVELPVLGRYALVIGAAAVAAYGLALVVSSSQPAIRWREPAASSAAAMTPNLKTATQVLRAARLVVENQQTFANEPLSLAVSVERATGHESVVLAGLELGTRLSVGAKVSASSWQVPSSDLGHVVVYAPQDFVGVMDTAIDLLSPTEQLVDSRSMRLQWIARKTELSKPSQPVFEKPSLPATRPTPPAAQAAPAAPLVPMNDEQAARLMKQGEDLLKIGDIASARLAFRRLAAAGSADAAFALALTFDPRYLADHNVIGLAGDEASARSWYERAKQLGSTEATRILEQMATK